MYEGDFVSVLNVKYGFLNYKFFNVFVMILNNLGIFLIILITCDHILINEILYSYSSNSYRVNHPQFSYIYGNPAPSCRAMLDSP